MMKAQFRLYLGDRFVIEGSLAKVIKESMGVLCDLTFTLLSEGGDRVGTVKDGELTLTENEN